MKINSDKIGYTTSELCAKFTTKRGEHVRYCWLFSDGRLSGILSKSEVEQFSDAKFKEAESLGYKLLELRDYNAR